MVKAGAISLKAVVPGLPKNSKDRELLEEDLRRIGCHGLLKKALGVTNGRNGGRDHWGEG